MASNHPTYAAQTGDQTSSVDLPAPTAWPIVLALGITLLFAGLVTSVSVSVLGAVLCVSGCVGWFREVLPHEGMNPYRLCLNRCSSSRPRPNVARVEWMTPGLAPGATAAGDLPGFRRE